MPYRKGQVVLSMGKGLLCWFFIFVWFMTGALLIVGLQLFGLNEFMACWIGIIWIGLFSLVPAFFFWHEGKVCKKPEVDGEAGECVRLNNDTGVIVVEGSDLEGSAMDHVAVWFGNFDTHGRPVFQIVPTEYLRQGPFPVYRH